jgi:hypothetical protein
MWPQAYFRWPSWGIKIQNSLKTRGFINTRFVFFQDSSHFQLSDSYSLQMGTPALRLALVSTSFGYYLHKVTCLTLLALQFGSFRDPTCSDLAAGTSVNPPTGIY